MFFKLFPVFHRHSYRENLEIWDLGQKRSDQIIRRDEHIIGKVNQFQFKRRFYSNITLF